MHPRRMPRGLLGVTMTLALAPGATDAAPPSPPQSPVFAAAISADRSTIVTTHFGGRLARWTGAALEPREVHAHDGALAPLALTRDGALLAVPAAGKAQTALIDRSARAIRTFPAPSGRVDAYAFSPDGSWCAVAGAERLPAQPGDKPRLVRMGDTLVRVYHLRRGVKQVFETALGLVEVAALAASKDALFALSRDGILHSWTMPGAKPRKELRLGARGQALRVGQRGLLAAVDDQVRSVTFDGAIGDIAGTAVDRIAFLDEAPDGTLAITGYDEVAVVSAGKPIRFAGSAELGTLSPKAALFLRGGRLAILGGTKFVARVLDLATGKEIRSIPVTGD